jgi:CheY-like chemotaxis protein
VRVLIVDDSSAVRFMLRILLEDAGMVVEEASCGGDAIARLSETARPRLDAAVLDQRMPDVSGLEVARAIVARGPHPRLFLYTAYLHPVQAAEAAELGVTCLVKTDLDQLVADLRQEGPVAAA